MVGGADRDHKFVRKVIDQLHAGATTIHAVADKLGTPTYTADFAATCMLLVSSGLLRSLSHGLRRRWQPASTWRARSWRTPGETTSRSSRWIRRHFADTYFAPRPRSEIMRNYMLDLHGLEPDAALARRPAGVPRLRRLRDGE